MKLKQPEFGRRLRQLRLQQGKSRADLIGSGMSAAYLSRLESGARPPTQRAVAYLAERLGVPEDAFAEPPRGDLTDILATLTLSMAKYTPDMCALLTKALEEASDADDNIRWQALAQLARMHLTLGDYAAEHEVLTQLRAVSDELGRPGLRVHARIRLGRCARDLGDTASARREVRQALAIAKDCRLQVPTADFLRGKLLLVSVEAELGDLAQASRLSSELCAALEHADGALAAQTYWTAATVSTRRGNHTEAAELMDNALSAVSSQEDVTLWLRLRLGAASLALQSAPPRTSVAEDRLKEARPALELIGSPRHRQEYILLQAQLAFHKGLMEDAAALSDEAGQDHELLTYRDRIRLEILGCLIDARSGVRGAYRKAYELANHVQESGMPELAGELWHTLASNEAQLNELRHPDRS
jgi:transcriptional regulator with XRE-family HTH domain